MRRTVPVLAAALVLGAPAAAFAASPPKPGLERFASCADLADWARDGAVRANGQTGVPFRGAVIDAPALAPPPMLAPTPGPASPEAMPVAAAPAPAAALDSGAKAGVDFSTTNVQEAGVDEPDLIKTDGRHVYVLRGGRLRVLDVTGPQPKLVGELALDGEQLLLRGDRLLALSDGFGDLPTGGGPGIAVAMAIPAPWAQKLTLTEVDVADPAAPKVLRSMELAGRLAGARLTGGIARVIAASSPEPIAYDAQEDSRADLRARVARTSVRRFLPRTTIRSRITRRTYRREVVECRRVRHPRQFSGNDLLTVLTIDLDKGLYDVKRDAVLAGAQTVYASTDELVVASQRFDARLSEDGTQAPPSMRTELHAFAASNTMSTRYLGSGSVPGYVLNQFALSARDERLRVVTTEDPPWAPDTGAQGQSESSLTVLRLEDGRLVRTGGVGGLGKGERVYAVRFVADKAYVVTFRQVDPLYVIDLADRDAPRVRGELKISGYSAYLHPVGDGLLLGVGQEASETGRRLGASVTLFDVSDPARPTALHRMVLDSDASSSVEQDHHAFLWWPAKDLAVVPVSAWWRADGGTPFNGAVGLRVTRAAMSEAGRIVHPAASAEYGPPPIGRSVVIGDRLLTLSYDGLQVNGLDDLAPRSFTPLG